MRLFSITLLCWLILVINAIPLPPKDHPIYSHDNNCDNMPNTEECLRKKEQIENFRNKIESELNNDERPLRRRRLVNAHELDGLGIIKIPVYFHQHLDPTATDPQYNNYLTTEQIMDAIRYMNKKFMGHMNMSALPQDFQDINGNFSIIYEMNGMTVNNITWGGSKPAYEALLRERIDRTHFANIMIDPYIYEHTPGACGLGGTYWSSVTPGCRYNGLVHEMGHYHSLAHDFTQPLSCSYNDNVDDTHPYLVGGCPKPNEPGFTAQPSCPNSPYQYEYYYNFMSYNGCPLETYQFTHGQAVRGRNLYLEGNVYRSFLDYRKYEKYMDKFVNNFYFIRRDSGNGNINPCYILDIWLGNKKVDSSSVIDIDLCLTYTQNIYMDVITDIGVISCDGYVGDFESIPDPHCLCDKELYDYRIDTNLNYDKLMPPSFAQYSDSGDELENYLCYSLDNTYITSTTTTSTQDDFDCINVASAYGGAGKYIKSESIANGKNIWYREDNERRIEWSSSNRWGVHSYSGSGTYTSCTEDNLFNCNDWGVLPCNIYLGSFTEGNDPINICHNECMLKSINDNINCDGFLINSDGLCLRINNNEEIGINTNGYTAYKTESCELTHDSSIGCTFSEWSEQRKFTNEIDMADIGRYTEAAECFSASIAWAIKNNYKLYYFQWSPWNNQCDAFKNRFISYNDETRYDGASKIYNVINCGNANLNNLNPSQYICFAKSNLENTTSYISDITLIQTTEAITETQYNGYTVVNTDLDEFSPTNFMYLGYKRNEIICKIPKTQCLTFKSYRPKIYWSISNLTYNSKPVFMSVGIIGVQEYIICDTESNNPGWAITSQPNNDIIIMDCIDSDVLNCFGGSAIGDGLNIESCLFYPYCLDFNGNVYASSGNDYKRKSVNGELFFYNNVPVYKSIARNREVSWTGSRWSVKVNYDDAGSYTGCDEPNILNCWDGGVTVRQCAEDTNMPSSTPTTKYPSISPTYNPSNIPTQSPVQLSDACSSNNEPNRVISGNGNIIEHTQFCLPSLEGQYIVDITDSIPYYIIENSLSRSYTKINKINEEDYSTGINSNRPINAQLLIGHSIILLEKWLDVLSYLNLDVTEYFNTIENEPVTESIKISGLSLTTDLATQSARNEFKNTLKTQIVNSLNVNEDQIEIIGLSQGSIIVDIEMKTSSIVGTTDTKSPLEIAHDLEILVTSSSNNGGGSASLSNPLASVDSFYFGGQEYDTVFTQCPYTINENLLNGQSSKIITWNTPQAKSKYTNDLTIIQELGNPSGNQFTQGTHLIRYSAFDITNTSITPAYCSFVIQINNIESSSNSSSSSGLSGGAIAAIVIVILIIIGISIFVILKKNDIPFIKNMFNRRDSYKASNEEQQKEDENDEEGNNNDNKITQEGNFDNIQNNHQIEA